MSCRGGTGSESGSAHLCRPRRRASTPQDARMTGDPADTATSIAEASTFPSEVRTFLIADVRGYTRFTQEHGDEAAARLTTRFAALAREVVEAWGGQVLELRRDEVLAVFGSARQALRAALALHGRF